MFLASSYVYFYMWDEVIKYTFHKQTMKRCEYCGSDYTPNRTARQKYCSRSCKDKAAWKRFKESGDIRQRKGGYNRLTYIKCWLRQIDLSVPCFYCDTRIFPEDKWVLDHTQPLSKMTTRPEMLDADNLVIACIPCNVKKGSIPFDQLPKDFMKNK